MPAPAESASGSDDHGVGPGSAVTMVVAARHADRRPFLLARRRHARCAGLFDEQGLPRSKPASCRSRPATRPICTRRRRADRAAMAPRGALSAAPRRNSPARNCWPPVSNRSSSSPACSATASAATLHLPEFTMLEWYRAEASYDAIIADTIVVIAQRGAGDGIGQLRFRGAATAIPFAEPER